MRKSKHFSLLPHLLTVIFLTLSCYAYSSITLTDSTDAHWVRTSEMRINFTNIQVDIDDIVDADLGPPSSCQTKPILASPDTALWLLLEVDNASAHEQWVVEFWDVNIGQIERYDLHQNHWRLERQTGNSAVFATRTYGHKNFVFDLNFKGQDRTKVLFRISSASKHEISPVIRQTQKFVSYAVEEYVWLGIFYGTLLLVMVYNLLFYFAVRSKAYIIHIGYVLCVALLALSQDGLGFQFIWPLHPHWNHIIESLALVGVAVMALLFTYSFFNMRGKHDAASKVIYITITAYILRCIVMVVLDGFPLHVKPIDIVPFMIAFVVGLYYYRMKGFVTGRYFIMAYTMLLTGLTVSLLEKAGHLPSNTYTFYAMNFAIVLEVILLSFALVHKVRKTSAENEENQAKLLEELEIKNRLKEQHNAELEGKVEARTHELAIQKELVEEKNKDITDSITYAQRIQQSILPPSSEIRSRFPHSFLLFKPRDIVSGDFYYMAVVNDIPIFAVIDCTGHGVPGGFMSMMGYSLLNQIIHENGVTDPGRILDELNRNLINSLRKTNQGESIKDGMDMVIFSVDAGKREVHFAGANNSLHVVRDGEILQFKGDRQPIGDSSKKHQPFKTQVIAIQSDDVCYAWTDGYIDQFGGPKSSKFMTRRLKKLLVEIAHNPLGDQCDLLNQIFLDWKGDEDQIDDVTLFGFKLNASPT